MNRKSRIATALVGAGVLLPAIGAGMAHADPVGSPTYRQLSGVGSDTTQDVMNGLADAVTINGVKVIGSYNAVGTATITTKNPATLPACAGLARPNGSGAGRTALLNSLNANGGAGDGCLDFSRSSSLNLAASSPSLTYIPFAVDGLTYVVTPTSVVPRNLTTADLQAIYHCNPAYVGTAPNWDITPMLPQAGSGTRSFWESQMGITDADVNAGVYPCIINGTKNGSIVEEHSGTQVDDKSLVPYSIPQYNSQSYQLVADRRGQTILGQINGTYPNLMNSGTTIRRDVYNVIPTSRVGTAPWSTVFAGSTSLVCQQSAVIQRYGFQTHPNCGDTTQHS